MRKQTIRQPAVLLIYLLLIAAPFSGATEEDSSAGHHNSETGSQESEAVELSADVLREQGLTLERAESRTLRLAVRLNGRLRANENRVAHLIPRFGGIIKEVFRHLGDNVAKGELLMTVESNQTLQPYEIRAPIAGVIVKRHAVVGELARESEEVFEVADLSELWADFYVFPDKFDSIRVGQNVRVSSNNEKLDSTVSFVSAYVDPTTQSRIARAEVLNKSSRFYPGQFIEGEVIQDRLDVKVAARTSAIQRWEGQTTLFVPENGRIVPKAVSTGASDGEYTEVSGGLSPGAEYYAGNVFIIKAELGKSLASHEH